MYFNIFYFSTEQHNFLVFAWCGEFHFSFATPVATFKNKLPTSAQEASTVKMKGNYSNKSNLVTNIRKDVTC
jgi:hypothetical protein